LPLVATVVVLCQTATVMVVAAVVVVAVA